MGVKIKHTDPTLNSFSTDDIIINVSEGSLFFKSNTELFRIKGDILTTTVTESFGDELWFRSGNNLYYTSGSVGIGTTSPGEKLEVVGNISSSGDVISNKLKVFGDYGVEIESPSGGPKIHFGSTTDTDSFMTIGSFNSINNIDTKARDFHLFGTNTTTGFYFDESAGKFGIGTTSPGEKLEVVGNIQATGSSNVDLEASTSTGTGKARLVLNSFRPSVGSMGTSTLFKTGSATFFDTDEAFNIRPNSRTAFSIQGNGDIAFVSSSTADANTTTYLFGDASTRNIGIGTTTPSALLHIHQSGTDDGTAVEILRLSRLTSTDLGTATPVGEAYIGLHSDDSGTGELEVARISWAHDNLENNENDGRLDFFTRHNNTLTQALTINSDSLVGIGNSGPQANTFDTSLNPVKLVVEGMVSASNGYEIASFNTSSAAHTKGWYTIATAKYGRAFGRFSIEDRSSGRHQGQVFYAGVFFGGAADDKKSINVISSGRYSTDQAITAIKITSGGTYTGHALQVYLTQASANITTRFLGDDGQSNGWKLIPMLTGSIDPGGMNLEGANNDNSSDDDTWSNGFPNNLEFDLGNGNQTGTTGNFQINGDLNVGGTVSKGGGSFKIDHPDPSKTDTHYLYHNFVESPTEGDNIYRWTITTTNNTHTIDLPDYYKFLNKNDMVWVNAVDHFGRAYGTINNEQTKLTITSDIDGKYNVLLIGTRKDQFIKDNYKGVEVKK